MLDCCITIFGFCFKSARLLHYHICVLLQECRTTAAIISICRWLLYLFASGWATAEDICIMTVVDLFVPWSQAFLMLTCGLSPLAYIIAFCVSYVERVERV